MGKAQEKGVARDAVPKERLTKADLQLFRMKEIFRLARLVVWFVGASATGYIVVYLPIREMAGKRTIFDFAYKAIATARLDFYLTSALAVALATLWGRERILRKNDVKRLTERSTKMEKRLDPGRSTSGLTPLGDVPRTDHE